MYEVVFSQKTHVEYIKRTKINNPSTSFLSQRVNRSRIKRDTIFSITDHSGREKRIKKTDRKALGMTLFLSGP